MDREILLLLFQNLLTLCFLIFDNALEGSHSKLYCTTLSFKFYVRYNIFELNAKAFMRLKNAYILFNFLSHFARDTITSQSKPNSQTAGTPPQLQQEVDGRMPVR